VFHATRAQKAANHFSGKKEKNREKPHPTKVPEKME